MPFVFPFLYKIYLISFNYYYRSLQRNNRQLLPFKNVLKLFNYDNNIDMIIDHEINAFIVDDAKFDKFPSAKKLNVNQINIIENNF